MLQTVGRVIRIVIFSSMQFSGLAHLRRVRQKAERYHALPREKLVPVREARVVSIKNQRRGVQIPDIPPRLIAQVVYNARWDFRQEDHLN